MSGAAGTAGRDVPASRPRSRLGRTVEALARSAKSPRSDA